MIDACKRASARSITAVLPYFGYARADRKTQVQCSRAGQGRRWAQGRDGARRGHHHGPAHAARALYCTVATAPAFTAPNTGGKRIQPCPGPLPARPQGREAIAAKLSANIITEAGADRVLAMDLHSGQCVGYFDIPVDHVYGDSGGFYGTVPGRGWCPCVCL